MAGSAKKAILRTLAGKRHFGYLPASRFVVEGPDGPEVEMLDLAGRVLTVALSQLRGIAFVRDFNLGDEVDPERLTRRTFLARPRSEGLWVRLTLGDGEMLEGLAPLDLSLLDGVLADRGLHLTPPDTRSNTQRLYIPRSAIVSLQLVAVITSPSKNLRTTPAQPAPERAQELLFPLPDELQSAP